jgi:G3E family GTPase
VGGSSRPEAAALPTLVIAGWLGAGKTTLVNQLLRGAGGRRVAVLVNDFGETDIDAELIVGSSAGVLSLAGGCLCCSFGDDLIGTLRGLCAREPQPQFVLIELSGVALPATVMRTIRLVPEIRLLGALVLADAQLVRQQAADRHVGATVLEQLGAARWLLLNKTDRVSPAEAADTAAWLGGCAPQARRLPGPASALPAEQVYGWAQEPVAQARASADLLAPRPLRVHRGAFASRSITLAPGADLEALARRFADARLGILRAKAIVDDGSGGARLLQWTPAQVRITHCEMRGASRLVIIGLREAAEHWPQDWLSA